MTSDETLVRSRLLYYLARSAPSQPISRTWSDWSSFLQSEVDEDVALDFMALLPDEVEVDLDPTGFTITYTGPIPKGVREMVLADARKSGEIQARPRQATISPANDDVRNVFNYWRERTGRTKQTKLDSKRSAIIRARLRDGFSIADLKLAVDGITNDPYYIGANDRGKNYTHVSLVFRDAEHVERFMESAPGSKQPLPPGVNAAPRPAKDRNPLDDFRRETAQRRGRRRRRKDDNE